MVSVHHQAPLTVLHQLVMETVLAAEIQMAIKHLAAVTFLQATVMETEMANPVPCMELLATEMVLEVGMEMVLEEDGPALAMEHLV